MLVGFSQRDGIVRREVSAYLQEEFFWEAGQGH